MCFVFQAEDKVKPEQPPYPLGDSTHPFPRSLTHSLTHAFFIYSFILPCIHTQLDTPNIMS